jgi:hypothetical protein
MLAVLFLVWCLCVSAQDDSFYYDAEFAPEGVESENPDLGEHKWALLYPPPHAPSLWSLPLSDDVSNIMREKGWAMPHVMGSLESCSKVFICATFIVIGFGLILYLFYIYSQYLIQLMFILRLVVVLVFFFLIINLSHLRRYNKLLFQFFFFLFLCFD